MLFSYLYKSLYSFNLNNKVRVPLRLSIIYASIISVLLFTKSYILFILVVSRMMFLSVKDILSFVRIGVFYISVFLVVIILAYTRSPVI